MAAYSLGVLLHQRGREAEAQTAYRRAIDGGYSDGWLGVGQLLAKQRGREAEAEAAFHSAIEGGSTGRDLERAAFKLGELLARRGEGAGARAAYEQAGPLAARRLADRMGVDVTDPGVARSVARGVRFRLAVAQRPWALHLTDSICAAVRRLASALSSTWQRTRRRST